MLARREALPIKLSVLESRGPAVAGLDPLFSGGDEMRVGGGGGGGGSPS